MLRTTRFSRVLALSPLVALVGSLACSAPVGESSSSSQQAFEIGPIEPLPACQSEYARVCAPNDGSVYLGICPCQPEIQTESYPGAPAIGPFAPMLACTLSTPIPVLPALAGEGCTLGVNATQYGNTWSLWACPAGTPAPHAVSPTATEVGYAYEVIDAANYAADNPYLEYCIGAPFAGWEFIEQFEDSIGSCPSGCPGGGSQHPADEGHH